MAKERRKNSINGTRRNIPPKQRPQILLVIPGVAGTTLPKGLSCERHALIDINYFMYGHNA